MDTFYEDQYGNEPEIELQQPHWTEQRQQRLSAQKQAEQDFFARFGTHLRYMRISPIFPEYRTGLLRCVYCHWEAEMFQSRPAKLLLCTDCAKRLKRERYNR